ncbi:hypothetical protein OGAPHI_004226 [Ogataea philodendri]|uniref:Mitochondrial import inner membrane translocase subunit TIM50 n=1 Tax=Ogataea philodendri TaxID=1378263 RepID=A0A9P8P681_9ASCO|nr:uncharacterized protein OGAPHI_004226 [Ogataea philodendri]KAH3666037.1 hypothetical protein OGAPHI_004226 [Ogataea philodendri]
MISLVVRSMRGARMASIRPSIARQPVLSMGQRFYADNKKSDNILDDDLLAKAGIDSDAPKQEPRKQQLNEDEFGQPRKRKNNVKSTLDKKKDRLAKLFWFSILGAGVAGGAYNCREWDQEEEKDLYNAEENGWAPGNVWTRFRKRMWGVTNVFTEPAFTDLLPPPLPQPYRHPLTLVLELDDLLVHADWDHKKGWKTAKRPGVDYFLGYLSQYYEIVIFSRSSMAFAETTVTKLDPYHAFVSYSLFREACRTNDGKVIKDLSLMNRDLAKLVIIDPDEDCYSMQPENAIPIDKWDGKRDDKLVRLIPFLEYLATQPVKDVRPVLASFKDRKNIPQEFAEREAKLREQWEKDQKSVNGSSLASSLLGISQLRPRKMPLDVIREHGQRNYLNMYNYLKENGEKLLQEEQQKTKELLADQNLTLEKIFTEGMPTAEDIAKQQAAAQAAEGQKK